MAHIDVVEAKPEEWKRDPFKLIEEGGYFYARGASDDKAMAAIWVDTLVRLRKAGFKPKRSIKMALTCGEETSGVFKGAQWLTLNHKDWVDAEIALNEGASGQLNAAGGRISLSVESGQKVYQDFKLTIDDPGGHSARPGPENAIANLAKGLVGLQAYDFPIILNDTTRTYFKRTAEIRGGDEAVAINALLADPTDPKAYAAVARNPLWRAMLKTTCVVTTVSGGHARNAVPQHAEANVNCRIFPGISKEETQAAIEKALGDPRIKVAMVVSATSAQVSPAPPLTAQVLGPIEAAAAKLWPGVPVIPSLSTGATDGRYFNAVGIPTYGVSGLFIDPDGGGVHGLDERIRVRSLYEGREFLYDLVQRYAVQGGAKR